MRQNYLNILLNYSGGFCAYQEHSSLSLSLAFPAFAGNELRYISSGDGNITIKCGGPTETSSGDAEVPINPSCNYVLPGSGSTFGADGVCSWDSHDTDAINWRGFPIVCDRNTRICKKWVCHQTYPSDPPMEIIDVGGGINEPLTEPFGSRINNGYNDIPVRICWADPGNAELNTEYDPCQMKDPNAEPTEEVCHFYIYGEGGLTIKEGLSPKIWWYYLSTIQYKGYVIGNGSYNGDVRHVKVYTHRSFGGGDIPALGSGATKNIDPKICSYDGSVDPCVVCYKSPL